MLKKIVIFSGIFIGVILIAALSIALVYEEQVKKIIVGQINKQLVAPVEVGEIKFSLIKNFPKASLSFYKVNAKSVYSGDDVAHCPKTLFSAQEISLQFNLKDLYHGNYTISKIAVKEAHIFLFRDKLLIDNYHCWKTDSLKTNTKVSFKMNQIVLQHFNTSYIDLNSKFNADLFFSEAQMKGEVFDKDFALLLQSEIKVNTIEFENTSYLKDKTIGLQLGILKKDKVLSFSNATAELQKLKLSLSGSWNDFEMNFKASGKELDIQSFLSLLPEKLNQKFSSYSSNGNFALNLSVKGKPENPQIKLEFNVANTSLSKSSSQVKINRLNLQGFYSNGISRNMKTSGLYINSFNANINESPIEGNFSVVDFTNPFIDGKLHAQLELAAVKEILQLDTFQVLEGKASVNLRFSGNLEELKNQNIAEAKPGQIAGTLQLKNFGFQFVNDMMGYEKIEADLYADDNYILLKQLSFTHGKSQIEVQGELSNYQSILNNNKEKAVLRAYLTSENFELEDWLPKHQTSTSASNHKAESFWNTITMKLKAKISKFKFENFVADRVKSDIYYNDNRFQFDSLSFNAMDGKAHARGAIALQPNGGFDLICDAGLSRISIDKLFEQLNNFGQKTLTNKHIAGKLTADIQYRSSWNKLNSIIQESILADANVLISDGELNNFTPMNKLSKFVSVNELSRIKFKELANTISIKNKKIYIPQFQINSSAMNLYCSGTHDFNNNLDYHFKVTLNELLSKKRKRDAKKNNEFEEIEEDDEGKTTLFISMTGNIEDPVIKFDKKELKKFVKDEIKNEKQSVKQLLKNDFGMFKNDKSLKEKSEVNKVKPKEFEVEWEENTGKEDDKGVKSETKNTSKNKLKVAPEAPKRKKSKEKSKEENSDDYL